MLGEKGNVTFTLCFTTRPAMIIFIANLFEAKAGGVGEGWGRRGEDSYQGGVEQGGEHLQSDLFLIQSH